jgi:hypothetical protein
MHNVAQIVRVVYNGLRNALSYAVPYSVLNFRSDEARTAAREKNSQRVSFVVDLPFDFFVPSWLARQGPDQHASLRGTRD